MLLALTNVIFFILYIILYIIFVKASNIQYNQSGILNYTLVLIAAYYTHCS